MSTPSFFFQVLPVMKENTPLSTFPSEHTRKIQDLFCYAKQAFRINYFKCFLFGLLLLGFDSSLGAEDLEAFLPKNTLYYASCDLEAFRKQGKDLACVRFTQDPEVETFSKHVWEVSKKTLMNDKDGAEVLAILEKGHALLNITDKISFAVWNGSESRDEKSAGIAPKILLSISFKDGSSFIESFRGLLRKIPLDWNDIEPYQKNGYEITKIPLAWDDISSPHLFYILSEGRFILSNDEGALLHVLNPSMPEELGSESLADNENFKDLKSVLLQGRKGFIFALNMEALLSRSLWEPLAVESHARVLDQWKKWGFDAIKWIGASSSVSQGLLIDSLQIQYEERRGLFSLLDGFIPGCSTYKHISPEAVLFSSFRMDPGVLLARLETTLRGIDKEVAEELKRELNGMSRFLGMDLDKAFHALQSTVNIYMVYPRYGFVPNVIATAEVEDGSRLKSLVAQLNASLREMGHTLENIRLKDNNEGFYLTFAEGDVPFSPAYCVADNTLIFAGSVRDLKKAFSSQQEGIPDEEDLSASPIFKKTLEAAISQGEGEEVIGVMYLDLGRILSVMYSSLVPWAGLLFKEISLPLDPAYLPSVDVLQDYFDALLIAVEDTPRKGGRYLSIRSASPISLSCFVLPGLVGSYFAALPLYTASTMESKTTTHMDIEIPSPESPFLGIYLDTGDTSDSGIHIVGVVPASPAEEVGLLLGDVLKKVGGSDVNSLIDLNKALDAYKPGEKVEILVLRSEEIYSIPIVLARRGDFSKP